MVENKPKTDINTTSECIREQALEKLKMSNLQNKSVSINLIIIIKSTSIIVIISYYIRLYCITIINIKNKCDLNKLKEESPKFNIIYRHSIFHQFS